VKRLEEAYRRMDLARQEADGAGAKFQLFKASAGTVEDFHAGLGARIGKRAALFPYRSERKEASRPLPRSNRMPFGSPKG
jgi:hypothetical protein